MPRAILRYDFDKSPAYWVCRCARAFERALNEELAPHGITYQQWRVLGLLAHDGEMCQADLARRLHADPPTLKGILDRMERDGWIERRPDPADRRKKLVRPLARVRPVWRRVVACAGRVRGRALGSLPVAALGGLRRTLAAMESNLGDPR